MRIAFVTAELAPHAQVGGLGDVSRWLPRALAAGGDEVCVFMPYYDVLDPGGLPVRQVVTGVELGDLGTVGVHALGEPEPDQPWVYLIDAPDRFHRGAVYSGGDDEHLVFGVLAAAVPADCDVCHCSVLLTVRYRGYAHRPYFLKTPWHHPPMIVEITDQYSIRMRPGFFRIRSALK